MQTELNFAIEMRQQVYIRIEDGNIIVGTPIHSIDPTI